MRTSGLGLFQVILGVFSIFYFEQEEELSNWQEILQEGHVKPLQWLVYYNDITALRAVLENEGNLDSINIHGNYLPE